MSKVQANIGDLGGARIVSKKKRSDGNDEVTKIYLAHNFDVTVFEKIFQKSHMLRLFSLLVTECIGILKRKVSRIFLGNLNFPALASWSEKFLGFFGGNLKTMKSRCVHPSNLECGPNAGIRGEAAMP